MWRPADCGRPPLRHRGCSGAGEPARKGIALPLGPSPRFEKKNFNIIRPINERGIAVLRQQRRADRIRSARRRPGGLFRVASSLRDGLRSAAGAATGARCLSTCRVTAHEDGPVASRRCHDRAGSRSPQLTVLRCHAISLAAASSCGKACSHPAGVPEHRDRPQCDVAH